MKPPPRRPAPAALTQTVARALERNAPLAGLLARVRESEARLAAIMPVLPAGLAGALRAGPLDDTAWVLLADHAAAAAKLRQCLPHVEAALRAGGWSGPAVKIKVRPATGAGR
ncbi:MAG TPA: hypothetical protein PLZ50_09800 [Rubrivivax sp.]|nr:hypothetical protein [Pseudomonadota bacterium]HOL38356.1 hypothetical protein [Rubrivivax sp.]HPP83840.1 hypothetical protein [Rubrivivax sp.]